jgi:DNA polymerase III subunit gamma/tau
MSEALYRKYRPKKFSEVLGQDEVVSVLERSIKDGSMTHAYLFSGGRGTGKTTVARIFAIAAGCKPADLYEIDGASNRGIDDVRALREAVMTMPFESPYKVYIIDEVHMLTKDAFNALLKTLEEPPSHVIFILATTEREKVPETVLSRCQTFTFRQPSLEDLKKHAVDIAKKEGVKLDGQSAELVALFGDGSYRDTLSVLEKVLVSASSGALDADRVAELVGAPTHDLVNAVLRSIDSDDAETGLSAIRDARARHIDMKIYLKMILAKLRAVLMLRYAPKMAADLSEEFSPDDMEFLKGLATSKEKKINSHVLIEFLETSRYIGYAAVTSLPLELALIKATAEKTKAPLK